VRNPSIAGTPVYRKAGREVICLQIRFARQGDSAWQPFFCLC